MQVRRACRHAELGAMYARAREFCADSWFDQAIAIANGEDGFGDLVRRSVEAHIEESELTEAERRQLINAVTANIVNRDRLRVDTLKWAVAKLAPKRYGKLVEETAGKPDATAVEAYLKRRHEQRRLNQLATEEERSRKPNTIFRVVEEIPAGRLTPQERRVYLARELTELARDAGMLGLAEQLDQLGKFAEEHPIDGPPSFTFNIDNAGSDEPDIDQPARPVTTIAIRRVPRGIDGREVGDEPDEGHEPNDDPERIRVALTPAPSHEVGQNGDLRARARVRGFQ